MKTWLQSILLFRDDKHKVVTNSYPYLRVDSIADSAIKDLDMNVSTAVKSANHFIKVNPKLFSFV